MEKIIDTLILSYNESLHIKRAIENALKVSKNVFVLDSYSNDNTVEIAKACGAKVFQNAWHNNYADQFNWGLNNIPFESPWILRLDADEYLTDELVDEVNLRLPQIDNNITGIIMNRRCYFMGKWIKRGVYPVKLLRLFRKGKSYCESRWMDEHMVVSEGTVMEFKNDFVDDNLNTINWYIQKHNNYAVREAIDYFDIVYNICGYSENDIDEKGTQANQKRNIKHKYYKLPLFHRAFWYFIYRYFIKMGFLDGKEALIFHFIQGFWYRFLVDCQIYEIKRICGIDKNRIKKYLQDNYKIVIN